MTSDEQENALMEAYPDVSICITHERWRHVYSTGPETEFNSRFQISLIPKDPEKVAFFYGATMEETVHKALDAVPVLSTFRQLANSGVEAPGV